MDIERIDYLLTGIDNILKDYYKEGYCFYISRSNYSILKDFLNNEIEVVGVNDILIPSDTIVYGEREGSWRY